MGKIFNENNGKDCDIVNRLAHEKSPYLLQHKDNPVNWYPWGEEALDKAKEENKPLFISIGYSTCHWCHVMNRESFQDREVAEILNKYFVTIKVDREERPDIDKVYMIFSEAMLGTGGWPLNVFATPDGKPFFIGTYFPKRNRNRITGIIELAEKINYLWKNEKNRVIEEANRILNEVRRLYLVNQKGHIDSEVYRRAREELNNIYDRKNGGFYSALDAESEGVEGKFYVFTYDEIIEVLGKDLGELYCQYYNITREGNFEGANNPNLIGVNIFEISEEDKEKLERARDLLFQFREKRIRPHRDEKILTSWNGLVIGSFAYAARVFNNEDYAKMAIKTADFIIDNLIDSSGNLLSTYIDGKAYNYGFLDDYSFLTYGLIELYETSHVCNA